MRINRLATYALAAVSAAASLAGCSATTNTLSIHPSRETISTRSYQIDELPIGNELYRAKAFPDDKSPIIADGVIDREYTAGFTLIPKSGSIETQIDRKVNVEAALGVVQYVPVRVTKKGTQLSINRTNPNAKLRAIVESRAIREDVDKKSTICGRTYDCVYETEIESKNRKYCEVSLLDREFLRVSAMPNLFKGSLPVILIEDGDTAKPVSIINRKTNTHEISIQGKSYIPVPLLGWQAASRSACPDTKQEHKKSLPEKPARLEEAVAN
jgi:hypothetical protein